MVNHASDERLVQEQEFQDHKSKVLRSEILQSGIDEWGYPLVLDPSSPPSNFNLSAKYSLDLLGNVAGKTVLDCGCGSGFGTVWLTKRGARVCGLDLSFESLITANIRMYLNSVGDSVSLIQSVVELLPFDDETFDGIWGNAILHHLTDHSVLARELHRVLKPGGRAVFVETSAINPLLILARSYFVGRFGIPRRGTLDERPLSRSEIEKIGKYFSDFTFHWAEFRCFILIGWYLVRTHWMERLGRQIDYWIYCHLPFLRRFSYVMVVEFVK